jgi:hypothetical protein
MKTWDFIEYIKTINDGKDILISARFKINDELKTTKWVQSEQWKQQYKIQPNYRQILKHEIVLEKDYPTQEQNKTEADKIIQKLEEQNINYWSIYTGSKSYHIHLFVPDLKKLDETIIPTAKKTIAKELAGEYYEGIDEANFYNKRLIQIEISTNPKTGKNAQPYKEKRNGNYPTVTKIEKQLKELTIKKHNTTFKNWQRDLCPKKCEALEYAINNNIQGKNKTRHHYIAPSLACYIRYKKNRDELAIKYYKSQNKPAGELESWDKLQTYFTCNRIREYFKDINKENICLNCLLKEVIK